MKKTAWFFLPRDNVVKMLLRVQARARERLTPKRIWFVGFMRCVLFERIMGKTFADFVDLFCARNCVCLLETNVCGTCVCVFGCERHHFLS